MYIVDTESMLLGECQYLAYVIITPYMKSRSPSDAEIYINDIEHSLFINIVKHIIILFTSYI